MGSSATFTHRESMLADWLSGAQILANGHYYASKRDTRWNDILGTAVITTIGILWFKEPLNALKLISIALIVIGLVGLNLSGSH